MDAESNLESVKNAKSETMQVFNERRMRASRMKNDINNQNLRKEFKTDKKWKQYLERKKWWFYYNLIIIIKLWLYVNLHGKIDI